MSDVVRLPGSDEIDPFLGYVNPDALRSELIGMYDAGGLPKGDSTGWPCVDRHYTVQGGQWTLVTGIPGMGKSEWLDALAVNLAEKADWRFAIFSPENQPYVTHVAKLVEKRTRKPFGAGPTQRMTPNELDAANAWVHSRFRWITPRSESPIECIAHGIAYGRNRLMQDKGGRRLGIIIDPWNMLDHHDAEWRDSKSNETDYVGQTLKMLKKIVRDRSNESVHVWIVAHPQKLQRDRSDGKLPVPSGYDVAGSAHWFNHADNIICVHRDKSEDTQDVDIYVQKVKFKHIGHAGVATLKYDRVNGRYFEMGYADNVAPFGRPDIYADPESSSGRDAIQGEDA